MHLKSTGVLGNNWSAAVGRALLLPPVTATLPRTLIHGLGHVEWDDSRLSERENSGKGFCASIRRLVFASPWSRRCLWRLPAAVARVHPIDTGPGPAALLSLLYFLLSGASPGQNHTEVCLSQLQVNWGFKVTPTYLMLSGHPLTFFLGAAKAKTSFFRINTETVR